MGDLEEMVKHLEEEDNKLEEARALVRKAEETAENLSYK